MAVDPLIVVGMTILIVVILVVNVYILVYYTHPEDKNESYLAKALVVTGLQLSAMSILMLPIGTIRIILLNIHLNSPKFNVFTGLRHNCIFLFQI